MLEAVGQRLISNATASLNMPRRIKAGRGTPEQREKVVIANEVKQSRIVALRLPRTLRVLAMTQGIE